MTIDCDILIAGDDLGRVWIYDVNRCLCESRQGKRLEELKETQVYMWALGYIRVQPVPIPNIEIYCISLSILQMLVCANGTVKTFNHVCSSTCMDYVVAVADSNVVSVWKRLKPVQLTL